MIPTPNALGDLVTPSAIQSYYAWGVSSATARFFDPATYGEQFVLLSIDIFHNTKAATTALGSIVHAWSTTTNGRTIFMANNSGGDIRTFHWDGYVMVAPNEALWYSANASSGSFDFTITGAWVPCQVY